MYAPSQRRNLQGTVVRALPPLHEHQHVAVKVLGVSLYAVTAVSRPKRKVDAAAFQCAVHFGAVVNVEHQRRVLPNELQVSRPFGPP